MAYSFKTTGHDVRSRLLRKLLVPVHTACAAQGLAPGLERLERILGEEIDAFDADHQFEWPPNEESPLWFYYGGHFDRDIEDPCIDRIVGEMASCTSPDPGSTSEVIVAAAGDEWRPDDEA